MCNLPQQKKKLSMDVELIATIIGLPLATIDPTRDDFKEPYLFKSV